jgi:hypothetical protein
MAAREVSGPDAKKKSRVKMVGVTMNPNGHRSFQRKPVQLPSGLQGGLLLNKIPAAIPWEVFVSCGFRVSHGGKLVLFAFTPQPITEVDEAVGLLRLLISGHGQKPGPLAWETVPENIRRHFQVLDPASVQPEKGEQSP